MVLPADLGVGYVTSYLQMYEWIPILRLPCDGMSNIRVLYAYTVGASGDVKGLRGYANRTGHTHAFSLLPHHHPSTFSKQPANIMRTSQSDSSLSPEPEDLSPLSSPMRGSGPAPRPPQRVQDPFLRMHIDLYKKFAHLDPSRLRMSLAEFENWLTSELPPLLEAASREAEPLPIDPDVYRSLFDQPEQSYGFLPFIAGNQRVPVPSHPSLISDDVAIVLHYGWRTAK